MPPAVIAGGIAAAGTIGGALISSSSQNHAIDSANAQQQQATQAQLQLGQESLDQQKQLAEQSLGLNQSIYNSNYDLLSPFVSRGNVAGDQINALLGLPSAPVMKSPLETSTGGLAPIQLPPQPTPAPGSTTLAPASGYTGPSMAQIMAMQHDGIPGNYQAALANYNNYYAAHPQAAPPSQTPAQNTFAPSSLQQHAQQAIAAGADPAAVQARLAQMGGSLQ